MTLTMSLELPIDLGETVSLIRLSRFSYVNYSTKCTIAGWGVTKEEYINDSSKLSNHLRAVSFPILPQERCRDIYEHNQYRTHFMGNQVFCAGYEDGGYDACQGDSGGPLVCNEIQIGLVSWGIGCDGDMPGAYINISYYMSWIDF